MNSSIAKWVAVEWGAPISRAWIFGHANQLIDYKILGDGKASLSSRDLEPTVLEAISSHLGDRPISVVCSGMIGGQHDQLKASCTTPCEPIGFDGAYDATTSDPRITIRVLPGVIQTSPADIMHGEELKIAGFIFENPKFDGIICLPGRHTKWVHISAGEIVSFRTFLTGELFALLSEQSKSHQSAKEESWDDIAFEDAMSDTMSSPQNLTFKLFGLRADSMLNGLTTIEARSKLFGMLIGLELSGAKPFWLGQQIAIVGEPGLSRLYESALASLHVPAQVENGERMMLSGFKIAHDKISGDD